MSLGKLASILALAALSLPFASCVGEGGSGTTTNTIQSAVQDLDLDADGLTTVVTFASTVGLAGATTANFETNGSQTATGITVVGDTVTIVWNTLVTPSNSVRAIGLTDVSNAFLSVTSTDTAAPTFAVTSGTQTVGLGGDSFVVDFSGAHVLESEVETLANWTLTIGSTSMDLTGSTIVFDTMTQNATFTLGTLANLHATFSLAASGLRSVSDVALATAPVAGTASGDSTAPTLVSAEQNLTEDEFGRVVDFTFSEAMDPVFSVQLSHFGVVSPDIAVDVTRPTDSTLRVAFNNPIVPGVNTVDLSNLVDAHGNAFADVTQAITQPSPVVNAFASAPVATTVANSGGDTISVVTTQAFDPDTATDPAAWTIVVDGNTVDLSTQTLTYDLATKTLTVALDFDMQNGDTFSVTGVSVRDVDGQTFTLASGGNAAGDATLPTLGSVIQNRNTDQSGKTIVVQFSEDVDQTTAETLGNWSVSGTQNLTSATLLSGGDSVRLVFDALVVPGDVTLGVLNVTDLAGNVVVTVNGVAIGRSDNTVPVPTIAFANAIEGALNDTVAVTFDDDMIESEIETPANWILESPVGTPVSTVGGTIVYHPESKTAELFLTNGVNFRRGDDASVTFQTCRDLAGNTVASTVLTASVTSETTLPTLQTVYRDSSVTDQVVVVFSEPCGNLDDLYDASLNVEGARYVLRSSGGLQLAIPTAASVESGSLAVRLSFGLVVGASDTLDVLGVVDLCGNPMFPSLAFATSAEDTTVPSLAGGSSVLTATSGESNDQIAIVFDRPMSPFDVLNPANYAVTGPGALDLQYASLSFDGDDTVTISLRNYSGHDLQTGLPYAIAIDNLWSAQGVQRTTTDTQSGIVVVGDAASPTVSIGDVRIDPSTPNALLIEASEALDGASADTSANYDYDLGNLATSATRVGPRTVRAVFAVAPIVGHTLDFTVTDLAGNVSGAISRLVSAADTVGPLVTAVAGVSTQNRGRDTVTITFNEQVNSTQALAAANYDVVSGSRTMNTALARYAYNSTTKTVTINFAPGQELDSTANISVTIRNVRDMSDNPMASTITVGGVVAGDVTAPSFSKAFVNWRLAPTGTVVDVLFSEDVDATRAGTLSAWSATGGHSVTAVTLPEPNHARLTLSTALGASDTVRISSLGDVGNNVATLIAIDPTE